MKINLTWQKTIIVLLLAIFNCEEKPEKISDHTNDSKFVAVYNYDNEQDLIQYNTLDLDQSHPNVLNPQISKADYDSVTKSWTALHQNIGAYLAKRDFNWDVEDETIMIVQKIYFEPNGSIKHFFFKILNPNVAFHKKEQFGRLISTFSKSNGINFQLDNRFAQCGKTQYSNL